MIMLTTVAASIGFTAISFAIQQPPVIGGAELLEERCSVCHSSSRPKTAKKTVEEWDAAVTRMMGKGAKLSEKERKTLADYLSAEFSARTGKASEGKGTDHGHEESNLH